MGQRRRCASLLVYCVCARAQATPPAEIRGVDDQPVYLIDDDGLCAVVSPLLPPAVAVVPDVPRILAFEKVVERFHRDRTVLPFRFGCVMDGEIRVREALRVRRGEYQAFLGRLNGCVEMGVRLLMPWTYRATSGDGPGPDSAADGAAPAGASPGIRYLHARRARFRKEERSALREAESIERCRTAFAGLYVDFRSELSPVRGSRSSEGDHAAPRGQDSVEPGVRMASLMFLVKKDQEKAFREAFRVLSRKGETKILLSGPWPPYSFVLGNEAKSGG